MKTYTSNSDLRIESIKIWELCADYGSPHFPILWACLLTHFTRQIRGNEIRLCGSANSALNSLQLIPSYLWPDDNLLSDNIDFEAGILTLLSGEKFYNIHIETFAEPAPTSTDKAEDILLKAMQESPTALTNQHLASLIKVSSSNEIFKTDKRNARANLAKIDPKKAQLYAKYDPKKQTN